MELEDKQTQRFENFVLMIEDEVTAEILTQAHKFTSPELRKEMQREQSKALIKVIVIKTMVNLQKKRAFTPEFINSMFGRKML
jgi:ribosome maturation protein Sdo1